MPVYVYETINPDGSGGEQFELTQRITEKALQVHPDSGVPVRRVIQPVFIGGTWSDGAMHKNMKDDKKLGELGFTKYVKAGNGTYEKRAGKGPDVISRDAPIQPSDL
jgi:hypothetical protein